jgi:hypothetical protein
LAVQTPSVTEQLEAVYTTRLHCPPTKLQVVSTVLVCQEHSGAGYVRQKAQSQVTLPAPVQVSALTSVEEKNRNATIEEIVMKLKITLGSLLDSILYISMDNFEEKFNH